MEQNNIAGSGERASAGWLKSSGFEGSIDSSTVDYRQSPAGTRSITIYGLQPASAEASIGIQIDFPRDVALGNISVPQPFPNAVNVGYFRQTSGGHRTTHRAKSGDLTLTTYSEQQGSVSGSFEVTADVDGTEHSFTGEFNIRTV